MKSNLKELLDKIYELEGLVHLALKRDEDSDDFIRLISKKGKEVGLLCQTIINDDSLELKEQSFEVTNFDLKEYSLDDDIEKEVGSPILAEIFDKIEDETSSQDFIKPSPEQKKGKLIFSINERFRFRRELFDNSDADFNNTMALVASMENYDEAEDYFINEEGFEPSDPIVKEFLDVIKRYYK